MPTTWCIRVMLTLGLLLSLPATSRAAEPAELARWVASLDASVLSVEQRKAAANRLPEDLRQRIKKANERSTFAWKGIDGLGDRAAFEKWRAEVVRSLRASLGAYQSPSETLDVHVSKSIPGEGFKIDNVVFTSGRGLWITANLYRPEPAAGSMPGILIVHSHHTPKTHGELQDMGMTWARMGCLVLVMDQLGHGERRQHPFNSEKDYPQEFRPSRQDYFFRYDNAALLHLAGESQIGWMAWDLMRGVDLLLAQPGIDPKRIALFGSVAGGGDPAAVTGAIDERISVVGPFNFGGPQPETKYPLPDDAETWFNYAGGGSWESTRNLRRSADTTHGTFLPWEIVASIAPRRLIYGHEFSWDQPRDPVWKRLKTAYGVHGAADHLAFTHGTGEIRVVSADASHCTHIGKLHRVGIHAALAKWFGLPNGVEKEYSKRVASEDLMAFTPELREKLRPATLPARLGALADEQRAAARKSTERLSAARRKKQLQTRLAELLGSVAPATAVKPIGDAKPELIDSVTMERIALQVESEFVVPLVLLKPTRKSTKALPPVVVGVSQQGKSAFLKERGELIAELLAGGAAVCLPDVRGTGETKLSDGRDRTSEATSYSSSELMLGGTHVGLRLRDLRSVLVWLRGRSDLDAKRIALWGDSFAEPNSADVNVAVPHGIDGRPKQSEPLGGILALCGALYEDQVQAVYVSGGLTSFRSVLDSPFVYIPHDAVVPGLLTAGDLADVSAALAPRPVRLEGLVDGLNRTASADTMQAAYRLAEARYEELKAPGRLSIGDDKETPSQWLLDQLRQ